jgi:hypothetical protein
MYFTQLSISPPGRRGAHWEPERNDVNHGHAIQLTTIPSSRARAPFQLHPDVEDKIASVLVIHNRRPIAFADDVLGFHRRSIFITVEEWDLQ